MSNNVGKKHRKSTCNDSQTSLKNSCHASSHQGDITTHQPSGRTVLLNQFFQGTAATQDHFEERLCSLADKTQAPISVYLHIPFSPYQLLTDDTLSIASKNSQDVDNYIDALEHEIQYVTQRIGHKRLINQLHLGGNAPNSISQKHLVRIQDIIERHFVIDIATETSLIADPGRASFAQMELLNGLGYRQINYGVCDLDTGVQETIGRIQSPNLIKESFQASREAGFELITSDLLYGIPNQTVSNMQRTIEHYLDIQPDRINCRSFNTNSINAKSSSNYSPKHIPSLADKMATFNAVVDGLTSQGYEWIGLDCFARISDPLMPKNRQQSLRRNRIGYSTSATSEILGFGSNAISEIGGVTVQNHANIDQWSSTLRRGELAVARGIKLSGESRQRRDTMAELMCNMQTDNIASLINDTASEKQIREYEQLGVIEISGDSAKVTASGQFFLSQLWNDVLPHSLPH